MLRICCSSCRRAVSSSIAAAGADEGLRRLTRSQRKHANKREERFASEVFVAGRSLRKRSHSRSGVAAALEVQRTAVAFAAEHGFESMRPGDLAQCMAGLAHIASSPSGRATIAAEVSDDVLRGIAARAAALCRADEDAFSHQTTATMIGATVELRRELRWSGGNLLEVLLQRAELLVRRGAFNEASLAHTLNSLSSSHAASGGRSPPPGLRSFLRTLSHAVVTAASDDSATALAANALGAKQTLRRHGVGVGAATPAAAGRLPAAARTPVSQRARGRDIAVIWNALSRLAFDDGPLLAALAASASGCAARNDFTPQGLGMVLNAVSKLGYRDDVLMRALLARVHEQCDAMNSQSTALTLNALSRLKWHDPPLVARLSSLVRAKIDKFSGKELVIVTNALSQLDYTEGSDLSGSEAHVAALSGAIRRQARTLDRHGVTLALEGPLFISFVSLLFFCLLTYSFICSFF